MTSISAALRDRRYLLSSLPWRALAHLLTTAVVLIPIAGPVWLIALPWLDTAGELRDGRLPGAPVVVLMAFGVVLVAVAGPLVAVPLAAVERRRITVVDDRPLIGDHRDTHGLSERERAVLELVAEGHSNSAVASRLFITEAAVGKHVGSILANLGLPPAEDTNRRVPAVLAHLRSGVR